MSIFIGAGTLFSNEVHQIAQEAKIAARAHELKLIARLNAGGIGLIEAEDIARDHRLSTFKHHFEQLIDRRTICVRMTLDEFEKTKSFLGLEETKTR